MEDVLIAVAFFAYAFVGGVGYHFLVERYALRRLPYLQRLSPSRRQKEERWIRDRRSIFALKVAMAPIAYAVGAIALIFAYGYGLGWGWRVASLVLLPAGVVVSRAITARQIDDILVASGPKANRRDHQSPAPRDAEGTPPASQSQGATGSRPRRVTRRRGRRDVDRV